MRSTIAFAFSLALAGVANSQIVEYKIEPSTVPLADRNAWCNNQKTSCPLICYQLPGVTGLPKVNTCDAKTLEFSCICNNGMQPNSTQFTQTLPYHICQEWQNQCIKSCGQNNVCQDDCRAGHPCGAQDPPRPNTTTTSTTMSSTATSTATSSGDPFASFGDNSSPGKKNGAASTLSSYGTTYGMAVVITGIFAGFTILL